MRCAHGHAHRAHRTVGVRWMMVVRIYRDAINAQFEYGRSMAVVADRRRISSSFRCCAVQCRLVARTIQVRRQWAARTAGCVNDESLVATLIAFAPCFGGRGAHSAPASGQWRRCQARLDGFIARESAALQYMVNMRMVFDHRVSVFSVKKCRHGRGSRPEYHRWMASLPRGVGPSPLGPCARMHTTPS